MQAFSIPNSAVVEIVGGISKSYLSRLLSPTDPMTASDAFWMRVEKSLPALLEQRRGQVFEIKAASVESVEKLESLSLSALPK